MILHLSYLDLSQNRICFWCRIYKFKTVSFYSFRNTFWSCYWFFVILSMSDRELLNLFRSSRAIILPFGLFNIFNFSVNWSHVSVDMLTPFVLLSLPAFWGDWIKIPHPVYEIAQRVTSWDFTMSLSRV